MRRNKKKRFEFGSPQIISVFALGLLILSGGAYHLPTQALLLISIGLYAFFLPPKKMPSSTFILGSGLLIALLLLQLIPLGWNKAEWRQEFVEMGIAIPSSISAQPLVTLGNSLLVIAGIIWILIQTSLPINPERRWSALQVFAGMMALFSVFIFLGAIKEWRNPIATNAAIFTFLPSRNSMSVIIATGGIVSFSLALEALRKRPALAVLNAFFLIAAIMGLIASYSRAGIILFILGGIIWVITARQHLKVQERWKILLPTFLWIIIAVAFLGGATSERFYKIFAPDGGGLSDFRFQIWRDTFTLILDQPIFGIGLGNFEYIFPLYRDYSTSLAWVLHPESDLFWWWAEIGLVGVVFIGISSYGLFRSIFRKSEHMDRYRKIAIIAGSLIILHLFVDVSFHRPGAFFVFAFLYGLSRVSHHEKMESPPWLRKCIRGSALLLFGYGFIALISHLFNKPFAYQQVPLWAESRFEKNLEVAELKNDLELAETLLPLSWEVQTERGKAAIRRGDFVTAEESLEAALHLGRGYFKIPKYVGDIWHPYNFAAQVRSYSQALDFCDDTVHARHLFGYISKKLSKYEGGWRQLDLITRDNNEIRSLYLRSCPDNEFLKAVDYTFKNNFNFNQLPFYERFEIFNRYRKEVSSISFEEILNQTYQMEELWMLKVFSEWESGNALIAHRELLSKTKEPNSHTYGGTSSDAYLRGLLKVDMRDYAAIQSLLDRYIDDRKLAEALNLVKTIPRGGKKPQSLYYWIAQVYFLNEDYDAALKAWVNYFDLAQ